MVLEIRNYFGPSRKSKGWSNVMSFHMFCSMPTFARESWEWLAAQSFWQQMSWREAEKWLEYREQVTMSYQDPLEQRSRERNAMSTHDLVENSTLNFHHEGHHDADSAEQLLRVWSVLGADCDGAVRKRLLRATKPHKVARCA